MEIVIEKMTYKKMMHLLKLGLAQNSEVSGYANVTVSDDFKTFYISDAVMPKQVGSGAETEIDDKAKAKLMFERRDMPFGMKCHWHTHPRMGAFWSSTDKALIKKLGEGGWMVFLVMNEKEEIMGAFYENQPTTMLGGRITSTRETFLESIPVYIEEDDIDKSILDSWDAEFTGSFEKQYTYDWRKNVHGIGHTWKQDEFWVNDRWNSDAYWKSKESKAIAPPAEDMPYVKVDDEDDEAWVNIAGHYYYNPMLDKACKTDQDRLEAMMSMSTWDEANELVTLDKRFRKFWNRMLQRYGATELHKLIGGLND